MRGKGNQNKRKGGPKIRGKMKQNEREGESK